jgi:hypothetical protein
MSDEPLTSQELDDLTKDELLAYGQELGISPMNAGMTKDEIRTAIDFYRDYQGGGEAPPEVELQVTTTSTKDFLGVPLVNPTPGTSQATDRLGRSVIAGNKDYLARNLVP